jgi:hypothetical protein
MNFKIHNDYDKKKKQQQQLNIQKKMKQKLGQIT